MTYCTAGLEEQVDVQLCVVGFSQLIKYQRQASVLCDATLKSTNEIGSTRNDGEPSQDNQDAPEKEEPPVTPP